MRTRKITLAAFCLAENTEEMKKALSEAGQTIADDTTVLVGVKVEDSEPTPDEDRAARIELDEDDDDSYTQKVHDAVADALGYEVDDARISQAMLQVPQEPLANLKELLKQQDRQFQDQGGRGVGLAEEIDDLRIAIAVQENS